MLKKLKKKLKIHSPSRAFRDEVGLMTAKGLAQGVDKGAPEVYQSLDKLGNNMISMSSAMASSIGNKKTSDAIVSTGASADSKMDMLITLMYKLIEKDANVYIDKKNLVGAVGDDINRYLGAKMRML